MEAKTVSEEESHGGSWSSSTNWVVAEGSLDGTVSFETSAEDAAPIAGGLLLRKPEEEEGENSSPCEVTVFFREKHEIHRVYVRSTARVYEIYYATDHQNNSKEYLCTVRCGAAAKQIIPPFSSERAFTECQDGNDGTVEKNEKMTRNDSANSDEDGWVEVKAPESPLQDMPASSLSKRIDQNASEDNWTHYEATAEISNVSPCISLTVRLLSLQTKTFVHVEEIYIYADRVEAPDQDPSVTVGGDFGGSSLLAMLVPGLLQLPKSGTSGIHERYFSDNSGLQRYQWNADKANDPSSLGPGTATLQEATSISEDQTVGLVLEQTKSKLENAQLGSNQNVIDQEAHSSTAEQKLRLAHEQTEIKPASEKVIDPDHIPTSVIQGNTIAYGRIEKVLDELVSRMGRIEAFCSRFEENMMQPLSRIEMRLQQLEQRFNESDVGVCTSKQGPSKISGPEFSYDESDSDVFAVGIPSSERIPSSKISAPEFSYDESGSDVFAVGIPSSERIPSSKISAPEFSYDESESDVFAVGIQSSEGIPSSKISAPEFSYDESESDAFAVGIQSSERVPSSRISAPEFSYDEFESDTGIQSFEQDHSSKVSAPDFSYHESDSDNKICDTSCTVRDNFACHGPSFPAQELATSTSASESSRCPGLEDKATELSNEHDECINMDDTLDSGLKDCSKETPLSIDGALASALAAFLTSTTISPEPSLSKTEKTNKLSDVDDSDLDSSPARAPKGADDLVSRSDSDKSSRSKLDAVKKEITFGDPLSSAEVVADDNPFSGYDLKNQDCNSPNVATEVAAIDESSLLGDDVGSPVSPFHMCPGLIISAPEFPIEEGDFINCEEASDSNVRENQPPTSALFQFLSSRKVESPNSFSTSTSAPIKLFNTDNDESTFSATGAEELGIENRGGFAKGNVDGILNFLPLKASLEHNEHENLEWINLLEVPVGRLINICTPFENDLEQNDQSLKWHTWCSTAAGVTETEKFMQNLPHHGVVGSDKTVSNNKWAHESRLDDSDAEDVAHSGLSFNQEGRLWTEDSSTDSSFDENFIKNKVQIDWSDDSSIGSLREAFTVSQQSGQAVDTLGSPQASVERTMYGDDLTLHFENKKSIGELGPELNSAAFEDLILDVKFAGVRDWRKGLPLEVLLAETSNFGVQVSAFNGNDNDDDISAGRQHNSYSHQGDGSNLTIDNQLLVDVENHSVPTETASMSGDLAQASVINDQQPFSSLI